MPDALVFSPLTTATWSGFEHLFGERGACGGCWCMTWRLSSREYEGLKGEGNHQAMQALVEQGRPAGILAFLEGEPVAWCAIAPREDYIRLNNSRVLKPVDDQPVWSLPCFFIHKDHRRKGYSRMLILAAVDYARNQGARIIEAYPIIPKKEEVPPVFAFTGLASTFLACGFREVARRSETRPIMRWEEK